MERTCGLDAGDLKNYSEHFLGVPRLCAGLALKSRKSRQLALSELIVSCKHSQGHSHVSRTPTIEKQETNQTPESILGDNAS